MNYKDIAAYVKSMFVGADYHVAGDSHDNAMVTGATIDRLGFQSLELGIGYNAVLASGKTLSAAYTYQESADGNTWDTAVTAQAATVVATGESGGSTEVGTHRYSLDLSAKKRYIRFNVTMDLNNTSTDTNKWGAIAVLGGSDNVPI